MKNWILAVAAAASIAAVEAPVRAQVVPAETPIYVTLDQSVGSKDAKTGQQVSGSMSSGRSALTTETSTRKPAVSRPSNPRLPILCRRSSARPLGTARTGGIDIPANMRRAP